MISHQKIVFKLIFLSFICLLNTACEESLYPIDVSEKFWRAVKDKDVKTIQKYSTGDSLTKEDLDENILPLDEIILGRTVIDGDNSWVDTTVTISGDKPLTLPLRTVLIRENNQWEVDYDETIKLVSKGSSVSRIISSIRNMREDLTKELNQSMENIQNAIPEVKEEIEKIEESLLEHVPELKKQIEDFVKDLKEAIKGLGEGSGESTATTET
jgi:gas vesicle protein